MFLLAIGNTAYYTDAVDFHFRFHCSFYSYMQTDFEAVDEQVGLNFLKINFWG